MCSSEQQVETAVIIKYRQEKENQINRTVLLDRGGGTGKRVHSEHFLYSFGRCVYLKQVKVRENPIQAQSC